MKILVVSDSHGRNTFLDRVLKTVGPIDMLLHLGDLEGSEKFLEEAVSCPTELVSGNNDYFTKISREKIIQIEKYRVFMTHGHRYGVNFGLEGLKQTAKENGADVVLFGHTHMPLIDYGEGIIAANPGSISQPRQPGRIPSYLTMETDRFGELHFTIGYVK